MERPPVYTSCVMDGNLGNPLRLESPVKVTISYTHSCRSDCRHCYADCGAHPDRRELSATEWLSFIDYLKENGIISILFEGGEPLCRSDFMEVLEYASRFMMTKLRSNGTTISETVARDLDVAKVGEVFVDFMGARKATHEYFVRSQDAFDKARDAVKTLLARNIKTSMLMILTRQNHEELQEFIDLADSLGVRKCGALRLYPIGRAKRNWGGLALSLDEMMETITGITVPDGMRFMQSWHPNDQNCCWQMAAVNA